MTSHDPIRQSLADFALAAGQNQDAVQRAFGEAGPSTSLGARAQDRLDAFMRDSGWLAKFNAGDMEARDQFNALSVAIAWQHQQDQAAEIAASRTAFEQQQADGAAADQAATDKAAAETHAAPGNPFGIDQQ